MRVARVRRALFVLLAYLVLALILTYPLVLHLATHVPGDGSDDPALAWNLWWVPHALLNLQNPIYTDRLFYPIGVNLAFYTLTYLNAFLSVPVQFAFGLVPAANVNVLLSFALSGFGAYLLALRLLGSENRTTRLAAFAAGLLYAFSSNKFLYVSLGQYNIASSQWIPFYILYLVRLFPLPLRSSAAPVRPLRLGLLLGLFLLFQALSEFTFASFLILFSIAYLACWLIAARFRIRPGHMLALLAAVVTFVLPMSPILAAMLRDMEVEGDFIQSGLGFSNVFSGDLLGFLIPSHLHPLFGGIEAGLHFTYINFVYLGFIPLALALLAVWRSSRARLWGLWFALTWLITLGPTLRINGAEYNLPFMPFNLLLQIPFIKGNRYPSRWSVMLTLFLAILAAYGVVELARIFRAKIPSGGSVSFSRIRSFHLGALSFRPSYLLGALLLLGLLFEHLSLPLPLTDFRVPSAYAAIAADSGDFAVMELPLTWRNGFRVTGSYRAGSQGPIDREFMLAQWYQSAHGHPILNGNTSRNPELKFQYFSETPVLNSLVALQGGHSLDDATLARDRLHAPRVLQFFGVRYIVWHTPFEPADRDVANRTRAYVEQALPVDKVSESYENGRGTVVYRVRPLPAAETITTRPDDPLARLYFAEGWGALGQGQVVAQRGEARILFPLSEPTSLTLTLPGISGFGPPEVPITVNGHPLPLDPPTSAWHTIVQDIPASDLHAGVNELVLHFSGSLPIVPADNPRTRLPIGQTGAASPVALVVRSAGEEQGSFGHIYVNGVDQSPNARGYNLVVINPQTGQVESRAGFDTMQSVGESARMAEFIAAIPDGRIVAAAVQDEASLNLTPAAVDALQSLGGKQDLRGRFRWSHALLGVKGAAPGTALEAASETSVSQLVLGLGATEPRITGTLGEIKLEIAP